MDSQAWEILKYYVLDPFKEDAIVFQMWKIIFKVME
jgi:hypothetical protein